jgi:hypothetical protein
MRFTTVGLWAGLLLASASAGAATSPPPSSAGHKAPAAPPATPPPPPPVKLSLEIPSTVGLWTMHLTNEGDVPVIVVADARLLRLEVTARGAARARTCDLPADMRPQDDLQRALVLAPEHEYVERFDPRLYCLQGADLEALAPTSIVVARLGWPGAGSSPPLEIAAVDGVKPDIAPRKNIESEPVSIPDEIDASSEPAHRSADAPKLLLSAARAVDAESPNALEIPVTLVNEGSRAIVVRFRPETIGFDVIGPGGAQRCAWPALPAAPLPSLFTTLAPRASTTLELELAAYCPTRTFDQNGLFLVRPLLDTRAASGAHIGVRAFEGVVAAKAPTLVRLHRGLAAPTTPRPQARPLADSTESP